MGRTQPPAAVTQLFHLFIYSAPSLAACEWIARHCVAATVTFIRNESPIVDSNVIAAEPAIFLGGCASADRERHSPPQTLGRCRRPAYVP